MKEDENFLLKAWHFIMGPEYKPKLPVRLFIVGFVVTCVLDIVFGSHVSFVSSIVSIGVCFVGVGIYIYRQIKYDKKTKEGKK
jgi:hypothetical protein